VASQLYAPAKATLLLSTLIWALSGINAYAQSPTQAQQNAIRQSCRSDYQTHCSSVPTGGSAALQCLKDNIASLSPACQTAIAATQGGAAPQGGAASSAPAAPSVAAASQPRTRPPAMPPREEIALMRSACAGDFRMYCRGVRLGGGRALACLADHSENLSPPCRNAMAEARGVR